MAVQEPQPTPQPDADAPSPLLLPSLEIKNFRAFRHLTIEKLGRVNLITGKNNVGKTSLLEALWLYAYEGAPYIIRQLLLARDEFKEISRNAVDSNQPSLFDGFDSDVAAESIRFLFYGRDYSFEFGRHKTILIGPSLNDIDVLSISTILLDELTGRSLSHNEDEETYFMPTHFSEADIGVRGDYGVPYLVVKFDGDAVLPYRLDHVLNPSRRTWMRHVSGPFQFVKVSGLGTLQISRLWDGIALTSLQEEVVAALRLLFGGIEKVNLVGGDSGGLPGRVPLIKVAQEPVPIPLRSLGDGVNRLFGITLALINSRDGMVLLDEVDSGLHYSALLDVWRLIFKTARRLNVQVFATTHSWDCIEAFQEAAAEDDDPGSGVLVRLENRDGDVSATVFDERRLAVVTRSGIEVR